MPAPKKPAKPTFEDALGDLLSQYAGTDRDELISAMEIQMYALKEEADGED
jgi:hypothetical protein